MAHNDTLKYDILVSWNTVIPVKPLFILMELEIVPFLLECVMKAVTNLMIREYNIKNLGYDFMGFTFKRTNELSFHHMIVPHKDCRRLHIEKDGYVKWNGAILVQQTSHEYLHLIEQYERERFNEITQIMIEMNKRGELNQDSLLQIEMLLRGFEDQYEGLSNNKGNRLIKTTYHNRIFR